ncbi:C40 family peptidase [Dactylosporangium sp. NPDC006015]|uniref:C40 family peptidase n=1 Tax=Dactylosporangium sp. NPDC006015 TaxID=3154576 RepID=UPI00339F60A1
MGRVIAWAVGGVVAVLVLIIAAGVGAVVALFGGGGGGAASGCHATVTTPGAAPAGLTAEQAGYTGGVVCDGGDGLPPDVAASLPVGFTLPAGTPPPVVTAIGWALAQVGTPYTFGGDCTAAHSGVPWRQCDCSSLMQQAYRASGITIPRTTHDQVHAGTAVPDADALRPGDLILIPGSGGTRTDPGHVGMFIGSGLIVQAPKTGDVVKVSKLSGWVSQIAAIRRIVPS